MNTRISNFILCSAVALGLMACASAPKRNAAIEDARAAIEQVERNPLAGEVALKEIDAAHASLREAESLEKNHKPEKDINNAAYMAKRSADTAQQQIKIAEAKKSQESAESERQAIVLDAREREAKLNTEEAKLKTQAAEAKSAELAAQDAANQQRIARLEQELADMNAKKTERGLVLTLGDILFDTNQATLKPGAIPAIDRLAAFLKEATDRTVAIEGHTDNTGDDSYNQDLSMRRADSVRQALVSRGVEGSRVQAAGKGESLPIASNDSAGGRQQNRRVEVIISDPNRGASL